MSPVSRDSEAGRAYLDLQRLARTTGRPTQELLVTYVLERFLHRLSLSSLRERFVLKGGMLLAVLGSRRPTADVDLLARAISNDVEVIETHVREILAISVDDGVIFETNRIATLVIRDDQLYAGVRLTVPAGIDRARVALRIDVNVGDPVVSEAVELTFVGVLGDSFPLRGYPLATVIAEKVVTMIERGLATTRERDFADVLVLSRRHAIGAGELLASLRATAEHRGVSLRPLAEMLEGLGRQRQTSWTAFVGRAGIQEDVPKEFTVAILEVGAFVDPLLGGSVGEGEWDPTRRAWSDHESR